MASAQAEAFSFICPITNGIFEDPVKAEDGRTYEREGIVGWFASCQQRNLPITSPLTRQTIGTQLIADVTMAEGARKMRQGLGTSPGTLDIRSVLENVPSVHDLRKMFAILDPLRNILEKSLDGWQPPQLVVIGQESSGKSTLLERLAMMPIFPRNDNFCTRLPIHVRLRNTEQCKPATLEVFNVCTNQTEEGPFMTPTENGAVYVRDKMQEIITKEHGAINAGVSLERIIILTVNSPYVPSIDLIDMPGLVASPESMKENTRMVVEEHIQKHGAYSLYLATVNATEAPNLSEAIHLVQSKNLQDRTIGVYTMCDEVVTIERRKRLLIERFETSAPPSSSAEALEPHGWVCVMNKEIFMPDCTNFARLKQQALAEEAFMREHMPGVLDKGRAGCGALMRGLSDQFLQFLTRTWGPKTIKLLCDALQEAKLENAILGMPAFHVSGKEQADEARRMAANEAKHRMEEAKRRLVQGCCQEVQQIKVELTRIASEALVKIHPSDFPDMWKAQKERFMTACCDAVSKWSRYWVQAIKETLSRRHAAATTHAAKRHMTHNPVFELGRFPSFIKHVEGEAEGWLEQAKKNILEEASGIAAKYYGKMSPWVTLTTELEDVATVSISCSHSILVENVIMCFIEQGTSSFVGSLCAGFDSLCARVPDEGWIESCAKQREELLSRIDKIQEAKRHILAMLGAQSEEEMLQRLDECDKFVEEDCQFITGCYDPQGIAVDANGHIYVADAAKDVIKVFSSDGPNGTLVREFGSGYLSHPVGVAVDHEGAVYVCNSQRHCISVFNAEGTFVRQLETSFILLQYNKRKRVFLHPHCLAVDREGKVYVTGSTAGGGVQKDVFLFSKEGQFCGGLATADGSMADGLQSPLGLALDPDGQLYVANLRDNSVTYLRKSPDPTVISSGLTAAALREKNLIRQQQQDMKVIHTKLVASVPEDQQSKLGGVAIGNDKQVFAVKLDGQGICVWDHDGNFIKDIPCESPRFVAVDSMGHLIISQKGFGIRVVRKS